MKQQQNERQKFIQNKFQVLDENEENTKYDLSHEKDPNEKEKEEDRKHSQDMVHQNETTMSDGEMEMG